MSNPLTVIAAAKLANARVAAYTATVFLSTFAIVTSSAVASDLSQVRVTTSNFQTLPGDSYTRASEEFAGNGLAFGKRNLAATVGQWMDTSLSASLRAFNVSGNVGDGVNSSFGFRHSQTQGVDPLQWNADEPLNTVSELYLTQRVGNTWLHAMGTSTPDESRYDIGLRYQRLGLNLGTGSGRSLVRLGGTMSDLNPWFFAGGRNLNFDFSGVTATFDFSDRTTAEVGQWSLDMQGLESRKTRFVGLRSGAFYGRLYDVGRRDVSQVANAVELGIRTSGLGLSFRQVDHLHGAQTRRLSMTTEGPRDTRLQLSFGRDVNPFYRAAEDTRMMFSVSGRFGATRVMRQTDTNSQDEPEQQSHTARNIALIGGGALVLAAAAGGGGGDEGGSNGRFPREQGAAFAVLNSVNPTCVSQNREYGGWVYRFNDGSYSYIDPIRGDVASVNIGGPERVPDGTRATATYHCHGGPDPRYNNEQFSPQDIFADRFFGVNGYLATPGGSFQRHDFATGRVQTIGTVKIR